MMQWLMNSMCLDVEVKCSVAFGSPSRVHCHCMVPKIGDTKGVILVQ